jgi:hypothetical protein
VRLLFKNINGSPLQKVELSKVSETFTGCVGCQQWAPTDESGGPPSVILSPLATVSASAGGML